MSQDDDLARFSGLLRKWNRAHNLVSRETLHELQSRHIRDSLQLMAWVRPEDRRVLDIGSGGGLPAIPLAIASRQSERHFTLLEPVQKKAAFLRTVARELRLPVEVVTIRAEDFDSRETFDLVTARALAGLDVLVGHLRRFLAPSGHALLHKGRNYRDELAAAAQRHDFDVLVHPSTTDAGGVVLDISNVRGHSAP